MEFFQVCEAGLTFKNQLNVIHHINRLKKNCISIDAEEAFDKAEHTFIIKTISKQERGKLPQFDRLIPKELIPKFICKRKEPIITKTIWQSWRTHTTLVCDLL